MWRPPERIKHNASGGTWPTGEQAAASRLFSRVNVGPVTLAQRTWVPAMVPWRASEDGFVTPEVLEWYQCFARGRPGAIVVEATGIRDVPSGSLLRVGHDRFVPGLRDLTRVVREASDGQTRLFIQLIDFLSIRRRPEPSRYFGQFLAITPRHRKAFENLAAADGARTESQIRSWLLSLPPEEAATVLDARERDALEFGARERVTDTHLDHIYNLPAQLPTLFADAARRSREAGFDGVELHFAHAYTMASFLSRSNTREDGYGGAITNRVRLPLEVYSRVRAEAGADFVVGCRFLTDECITGGSNVEDAVFFGTEFARAGMDFLSLSRGGKFDDARQPKVGDAAYPYTGRSGYECMPSYYSDATGPFGRNLESTARVRVAVRKRGLQTPVIAAGGIHNFEQAETCLAAEQADIIGFARQALADPDWFRKVRTGYGSQVRLCLYTNYCEALDQRHRQVTCELWDRKRLDEPGIKRSSDGKRRLTPPMWRP
jgi:dimethylglycine catabolism A